MATSAAYIDHDEGAAPSTPGASKVRIYAKTDGLMYSKDDAGTETLMSGGGSGAVATDAIWDAAGDLAVGTGSNTAARLALGATGTRPASNGSTVVYSFPPGYEYAYAEKTTDTSITGTTGAGAIEIATTGSVAMDGSTIVLVEVFAPQNLIQINKSLTFDLWYDGSFLAQLGVLVNPVTATGTGHGDMYLPFGGAFRHTPTNASHTWGFRAHGSSSGQTVYAGAGSAGALVPAHIRVTRVSP